MASVRIDGELVEFEGPAPATASEAFQLIEGFVGGQGRVISAVFLDGEASSIESVAEHGQYDSLDFVTMAPEAQLLAMCRTWSEASAACIQSLGKVSSICLRMDWERSRSEVVDLLEELRSVIEGLGVLQNYGSESQASWSVAFGESFSGGIGAIDLVVDAIEARSPARLSDALAGPMKDGWARVKADLDTAVIPELEMGVSQ